MKLLPGLICCFLIPGEVCLFKLYCKDWNAHLLFLFPPPPPVHHFYYVIKRTRYILAAMGSDTRWCKGKRRYLHLWVIYMMTKINTWIFSACRLSITLTDKINTKPLSLLLKSGCIHFLYKLIYVWIYVLIIALNW